MKLLKAATTINRTVPSRLNSSAGWFFYGEDANPQFRIDNSSWEMIDNLYKRKKVICVIHISLLNSIYLALPVCITCYLWINRQLMSRLVQLKNQ